MNSDGLVSMLILKDAICLLMSVSSIDVKKQKASLYERKIRDRMDNDFLFDSFCSGFFLCKIFLQENARINF